MKIPLVQLVLESFEFDDCRGGIRYKIRPKSHFYNESQWREWNQAYAGRSAAQIMQDEDGVPYSLIVIAYPNMWDRLHLWADRVQHILTNQKDHSDGARFGAFFAEGGVK